MSLDPKKKPTNEANGRKADANLKLNKSEALADVGFLITNNANEIDFRSVADIGEEVSVQLLLVAIEGQVSNERRARVVDLAIVAHEVRMQMAILIHCTIQRSHGFLGALSLFEHDIRVHGGTTLVQGLLDAEHLAEGKCMQQQTSHD